MMANTALNRSVVLFLTNKSGVAVAQGDVVVMSAATAAAFTTTTTAGYVDGPVGVVLEPNGIANDAVGLVAFGGYVPKIALSGAASLGDLVKTHSVAKQGVRHAAPAVAGDFAQVLGTGTSPAAVLFGMEFGIGTGGVSQGSYTDYSATSTIVGWSSFTTKQIFLIKTGLIVDVFFNLIGTSDNNTTTFTVADAAVNAGPTFFGYAQITDNGVAKAAVGRASMVVNGNTIVLRSDWTGAGFTASGTKACAGHIRYIAAA